MKKITLALAGLMISGVASAVQLPVSGSVSMADCAPLNENVRINLSNNVVAGVSCSATTVALAACHTGGKVTSRTVLLRDVAADADAGIPAYKEACSTVGDNGCASQTVNGPAMPAATTRLGTVNVQYPGGNECTVGGAEAAATVMRATQ